MKKSEKTTQEQERPRGNAMLLSMAIARTIDRTGRKRRVTVAQVLRALEWTRYSVTEAAVKG